MKEAERAHLAAHRAAVRRGWAEADLKAFGIDAPTLSVGGRPREAKTTVPAAPAQPAERAGTVPAAQG